MGWNWIFAVRIAKLVAVSAFFLPWALLSCSSQRVASLSGFDLVLGRIQLATLNSGQLETHALTSPNYLAVLALLATVVGAASALILPNGLFRARAVSFAAAISIAILVYFGISLAGDMQAELRRETAYSTDQLTAGMNASIVSSIEIELQPGYWISLIAMLGAFGLTLRPAWGISHFASDRQSSWPAPRGRSTGELNGDEEA